MFSSTVPFFSPGPSKSHPLAVATNVNGIPKAKKPIAPPEIYMRKPNRMPKGLNRKDLISLDQARARPKVVYGGFANRTKEVIITDHSPLDHLAHWATEQGFKNNSLSDALAASSSLAASKSVFPPFKAFMNSTEDFDAVGLCQTYEPSSDSLASPKSDVTPLSRQRFSLLTEPVTATLIPLHVAINRPDIRYRFEGFEMT